MTLGQKYDLWLRWIFSVISFTIKCAISFENERATLKSYNSSFSDWYANSVQTIVLTFLCLCLDHSEKLKIMKHTGQRGERIQVNTLITGLWFYRAKLSGSQTLVNIYWLTKHNHTKQELEFVVEIQHCDKHWGISSHIEWEMHTPAAVTSLWVCWSNQSMYKLIID